MSAADMTTTMSARYEIHELGAKPEKMILLEILHHIAYDGKGPGNPQSCSEDLLPMRHFMKQVYRPERIVIAGTGVAHIELVELAGKHFSSLKCAPIVDGLASTVSCHCPVHTLLSPPQPSALAASKRLQITNQGVIILFISQLTFPCFSSDWIHLHRGCRFNHDPQPEINHIYISLKALAFMMMISASSQPCKYFLEMAGLSLRVCTKYIFMPSSY